MKNKNINDLENLRKAMFVSFLLITYIDMVLLTVLGYNRGESFYRLYYLTATALISSFSIYLIDEKYKKSFIIYSLSKIFDLTMKHRIIFFIVLGVMPLLYININ